MKNETMLVMLAVAAVFFFSKKDANATVKNAVPTGQKNFPTDKNGGAANLSEGGQIASAAIKAGENIGGKIIDWLRGKK